MPVCGNERYARDTGGGERTQQDTDGSVTLPFTFCAIVVVVIVVVVVDTYIYACMYDTIVRAHAADTPFMQCANAEQCERCWNAKSFMNSMKLVSEYERTRYDAIVWYPFLNPSALRTNGE